MCIRDSDNTDSIYDLIEKNIQNPYNTLIDISAVFKDVNNRDVVKKVLNFNHYNGYSGVYLDEKDEIKIIDSNGSEQEVRGEGVVGEQPILNPGEKFEYTSGTPLSTPSGFMGGHYEMETNEGKKFDAIIPQFSLDSPFVKNNLN